MDAIDMSAVEAVAEIVGLRDVELFILQVGRIRQWKHQTEE